jgi:hypothetical protein
MDDYQRNTWKPSTFLAGRAHLPPLLLMSHLLIWQITRWSVQLAIQQRPYPIIREQTYLKMPLQNIPELLTHVVSPPCSLKWRNTWKPSTFLAGRAHLPPLLLMSHLLIWHSPSCSVQLAIQQRPYPIIREQTYLKMPLQNIPELLKAEDQKYWTDVQAVQEWWEHSRWGHTKRSFTADPPVL